MADLSAFSKSLDFQGIAGERQTGWALDVLAISPVSPKSVEKTIDSESEVGLPKLCSCKLSKSKEA